MYDSEDPRNFILYASAIKCESYDPEDGIYVCRNLTRCLVRVKYDHNDAEQLRCDPLPHYSRIYSIAHGPSSSSAIGIVTPQAAK